MQFDVVDYVYTAILNAINSDELDGLLAVNLHDNITPDRTFEDVTTCEISSDNIVWQHDIGDTEYYDEYLSINVHAPNKSTARMLINNIWPIVDEYLEALHVPQGGIWWHSATEETYFADTEGTTVKESFWGVKRLLVRHV